MASSCCRLLATTRTGATVAALQSGPPTSSMFMLQSSSPLVRSLRPAAVASVGADRSSSVSSARSLHFCHNSIGLRDLDRHCLTHKVHLKAFNSTTSTSFPQKEDDPAKVKDEAPAADGADSSEADGDAAAAQLTQQLEQLQAKHDDLLDKYRRSLAESDNMRKRLTKQIEDAKAFGIQSFCKDLLDVADVLGKAVTEVPEEALQRESKYLRDVHEGLKLTESQLLQVFRRHGLESVSPGVGDKFDPNVHEALFQVPAPEGVEAGAVVDVQKVGYSLHGRTVRPALVGVAKK